MRMYKPVSLLCALCAAGNAHSVQITPQIQSLLDQKAAKIAELEKCDKNRKAFVIAGISTLGLTAVGIGGNIALANKNKQLDAELTSKKSELNTKRQELSSLQSQQLQERLVQQLERQKEACDAKGEPYKWTANGECRVLYDETKVLRLLKSKNEEPSITKQEFCNLKGGASEFDDFINQDYYDSADEEDDFWTDVNKLADFGFWCRHSGGDWNVVAEGHGWRCTCKNIPDVACGSLTGTLEYKSVSLINVPEQKIQEKDAAVPNNIDKQKNKAEEKEKKAKAKQEKKDTRTAEKERQEAEKQLCFDTGGWILLGECKCPKADGLTQAPDKKSCVCSNGVFDPDTKKCISKTDAFMAKYGDISDFDITEDNPFLDKRLLSIKTKKTEKEVAQPEEPAQTEQVDVLDRREKFVMGSEDLDVNDMLLITSTPKSSNQKTTAQVNNKASNNNQSTKQTPKQETEQNMMTNAEVLQILQNLDNDTHGLTKEEFCEHASTGGVGQSISKMNIRNNQARLQTMINNGLGHGYWCKKLGANWNVDYDGFGWYWYCSGVSKDKCSDDASKKIVQKSEIKDAFAATEDALSEWHARQQGTAEGYIYFLLKDANENVIRYIDIECKDSDGATSSHRGDLIGKNYSVPEMSDNAECVIYSPGYKSKHVIVRDLKSGVVVLERN